MNGIATRAHTRGAILLVAGCSIGAGMLGVPVITGPCGFLPAVVCFFAAWLFMLSTGLVLVDLVLHAQEKEAKEVHLITLASQSFGFAAVALVWMLFSFLFYCVLTAYMLGGGSLLTDMSTAAGLPLPHMASSILVALLGAFVVLFGTGVLDRLNRYLMLGLLVSYVILIGTAIPHIAFEHLSRSAWTFAPFCLPVMIISFGYHNLIPSLVSFLNRDRKAIRYSIIVGSAIPLVVYLIWEVAILGIISYSTPAAWQESLQSGDMVTQVLAKTSGSDWVVGASEAFALFALITSFFPVSWSFVDFLRDAVRELKPDQDSHGFWLTLSLVLAVFMPPLIISMTNPHLFLQALSAAGGYAAVVLFGILPVLMALKLKLRSQMAMLLLIVFALFIMAVELYSSFG